MVMNLVSGKVSEQEELKKIIYADDRAVVAGSKEDLQITLQKWINTFKKHSLRINLEKTEVMWIGEQEVDLHVVVDGKTIKQLNSFVYLGDTVCEDGGCRKENTEESASRSSSVEESGRHYVGQKTKETTKRKSDGSLRGTSLYIRVGNIGTDRETGGEDADSRKQLGPKNMQSNPRR